MNNLIRGFFNLKQAHQGCVLTIGNFDGVHIGHQKLLQAMHETATYFTCSTMAITFEPHPREFFGQQDVPRISSLKEKYLLLREAGIEFVLVLRFNERLASMPAITFSQFLADKIKPKQIIVGDDFRFGAKRQGQIADLRKQGFQVTTIPPVFLNERRVSSTWAREALAKFDPILLQKLLGRAYRMQGRIIKGSKLGRQLGFPTANIYLQRKLTPVKGVFTVLMHGIAAYPLSGVANIGVRPTVDGTRTLLEVHLLDFKQDIYGQDVTIEFCAKLRDEQRYPSLDLLKAQISQDVIAAHEYFKTHKV